MRVSCRSADVRKEGALNATRQTPVLQTDTEKCGGYKKGSVSCHSLSDPFSVDRQGKCSTCGSAPS